MRFSLELSEVTELMLDIIFDSAEVILVLKVIPEPWPCMELWWLWLL